MTRDIKRNPWAGLLLAAAAFLPARAAADTCDQNFNFINPSSWWGGAFGNCKKQGGPTDATAIFECAWAQVPVNETSQCLHDRLRQTDQTRRAIDEVAANNAPPPPPALKANGQVCASPFECQSGRCIVTCQAEPPPPTLKANGEVCASPFECQSGRCIVTCQAEPPPPTLKANGQVCASPF